MNEMTALRTKLFNGVYRHIDADEVAQEDRLLNQLEFENEFTYGETEHL